MRKEQTVFFRASKLPGMPEVSLERPIQAQRKIRIIRG